MMVFKHRQDGAKPLGPLISKRDKTMTSQNIQTVRKAGFSIESVADRIGTLILLVLGVSMAGATIMVGL
jgi:hypothetical protein